MCEVRGVCIRRSLVTPIFKCFSLGFCPLCFWIWNLGRWGNKVWNKSGNSQIPANLWIRSSLNKQWEEKKTFTHPPLLFNFFSDFGNGKFCGGSWGKFCHPPLHYDPHPSSRPTLTSPSEAERRLGISTQGRTSSSQTSSLGLHA